MSIWLIIVLVLAIVELINIGYLIQKYRGSSVTSIGGITPLLVVLAIFVGERDALHIIPLVMILLWHILGVYWISRRLHKRNNVELSASHRRREGVQE